MLRLVYHIILILKAILTHIYFSIWQDGWNGAVANKLRSVKEVLGDWQCRNDEIVLCQTRIGHTHTVVSKSLRPPSFLRGKSLYYQQTILKSYRSVLQ